jgi:peptidoglycan/LPS O-acetylase OafA/YrhL
MRRVVSIALFVLGGWLLSSAIMFAWMDVGQGSMVELGVVGVICAFALPFLLLGLWASPGRRLAELGLTLMIAAGVGAILALFMLMVMNDPSFLRLLPPDQKFPNFKLTPAIGGATVIVIGGLGWLLYRLVPSAVDADPGSSPR